MPQRLHSVHNQDAVCLSRVPVQEHCLPVWRAADRYRLPGREDRAATALFCDLIGGQQLPLSLCGRPAVASHCRYDKRPCSLFFQALHCGRENFIHVADLPAARCQCNPHSRANPLSKLFRCQQMGDGSPQFLPPDAGMGKYLPHTKHAGKPDSFQQRSDLVHSSTPHSMRLPKYRSITSRFTPSGA